jgi:hypothetical protein
MRCKPGGFFQANSTDMSIYAPMLANSKALIFKAIKAIEKRHPTLLLFGRYELAFSSPKILLHL